jgi:MerR family transcriptional regulator/heat shock protein HspR
MQLEEAVANMSLEVAKLRTEVDALLLANPPKSLVKRGEQTVVVYPKD